MFGLDACVLHAIQMTGNPILQHRDPSRPSVRLLRTAGLATAVERGSKESAFVLVSAIFDEILEHNNSAFTTSASSRRLEVGSTPGVWTVERRAQAAAARVRGRNRTVSPSRAASGGLPVRVGGRTLRHPPQAPWLASPSSLARDSGGPSTWARGPHGWSSKPESGTKPRDATTGDGWRAKSTASCGCSRSPIRDFSGMRGPKCYRVGVVR